MKNWFDLAEKAGVRVRGHYDESGITPAELVRLCELVAADAEAREQAEAQRDALLAAAKATVEAFDGLSSHSETRMVQLHINGLREAIASAKGGE